MGLFSRRKRGFFSSRRAEKEKKKKFGKADLDESFIDPSTGVRSFSSFVDLTLLDPRATQKNIEELIQVAKNQKYYCVIVPPVFVGFASSIIKNNNYPLRVGSVVGFPLGHSTTSSKIRETKKLVKAGADEIEVSLNLHYVKCGDYSSVKFELSRIVKAAKKRVVKVILETCYLTNEEIEKVLRICVRSKVQFVMTSSGYAPIGATVESIEKLSLLSDGKIGVKASGGIKTRLEAESFLRLGATRIGTSRII